MKDGVIGGAVDYVSEGSMTIAICCRRSSLLGRKMAVVVVRMEMELEDLEPYLSGAPPAIVSFSAKTAET